MQLGTRVEYEGLQVDRGKQEHDQLHHCCYPGWLRPRAAAGVSVRRLSSLIPSTRLAAVRRHRASSNMPTDTHERHCRPQDKLAAAAVVAATLLLLRAAWVRVLPGSCAPLSISPPPCPLPATSQQPDPPAPANCSKAMHKQCTSTRGD